jgi:hypothetical protein
MTNGVRKNGTTMPTAMATQFIITLNARRLVLAINYQARKLQDTTAQLHYFFLLEASNTSTSHLPLWYKKPFILEAKG